MVLVYRKLRENTQLVIKNYFSLEMDLVSSNKTNFTGYKKRFKISRLSILNKNQQFETGL